MTTAAVGFQTEYSQLAMEMVFAERRRQVKLGREGKIPHACEDPNTDWGYRLGVLGEEFGEVCTAFIEGPSDHSLLEYDPSLLDECVHTAAVALACAESILRRLKLDPEDLRVDYDDGRLVTERVDESGRSEEEIDSPSGSEDSPSGSEYTVSNEGHTVRFDNPVLYDFNRTTGAFSQATEPSHTPDTHELVLQEANHIYQGRKCTRPDVWRREGARGALFNMKICMERVWWRYWNIDQKELISLATTGELDIDDFLDIINYAVFAVILLRKGDRDGTWVYP